MNAMELMNKVDFDMDYVCEDNSEHTVHMHVKFGKDMAELSISVDNNKRRMWLVGEPYDQPNVKTGPEYYTKEDTIWNLRRYVLNNSVVEMYLECDGNYDNLVF